MTGKAFQVSLNAGESSSTTPLNMTMAELQCAYSVLEYKHKALQTSRQNRPGNGKGKNGKKAKGDDKQEPDKPVTKDDCKFYCHAHGYRNSHNSDQCKVMANQPQNFTAEMRKARDPNNLPGGSTAVRGRQPTVQATGFMITDHDDLSALASSPTETNSQSPLPVTPHNVPALVPRAAWMLEGDDRSDEQADDDWRRACNSLFGTQTLARRAGFFQLDCYASCSENVILR
jgi:hypothetical protein